MRVRMLRAGHGQVDGISLERFAVGRVYDVHVSLATYLLVERLAAPESDAEPALVVPLNDATPRKRAATTGQKPDKRRKSADDQ